MTLSEILADLYRRVGYSAAPSSDITTRLTAFVNQAHRQILSHPSMQSLRDDTTTFTSTAQVAQYSLPPSVQIIQAITDRTTGLRLTAFSQDALRSMDPGLVDFGTVTGYVWQGPTAVAKQPSTADSLYIKSTSASDTGTASYEGFRTGGYPASGSVLMTGTTAVALTGALTDLDTITKLTLATPAVGTVTVHQTSGTGTELARFAIGQAATRYQQIQLWPTPNAALTYHVDYVRAIPTLAAASDEPLLPVDFHYLLVEGALISEWAVKDDSRVQEARLVFREGLSRLRYQITAPPDLLPTSGGMRRELSRLGRWFRDGAGVN